MGKLPGYKDSIVTLAPELSLVVDRGERDAVPFQGVNPDAHGLFIERDDKEFRDFEGPMIECGFDFKLRVGRERGGDLINLRLHAGWSQTRRWPYRKRSSKSWSKGGESFFWP